MDPRGRCATGIQNPLTDSLTPQLEGGADVEALGLLGPAKHEILP
jgi:hypothetical protein